MNDYLLYFVCKDITVQLDYFYYLQLNFSTLLKQNYNLK